MSSPIVIIEPTIDYQINEEIEERQNTGLNIGKANFNLIFNNQYLQILDYFKYKLGQGNVDTLRGLVIQSDLIQLTPRFPNEELTPFIEFYKDKEIQEGGTGNSYQHLYTRLFVKDKQSFDDNVYVNSTVHVIGEHESIMKGVVLESLYDEDLSSKEGTDFILELKKHTDPTSLASLRVNNLYVEGDYTIVNTEEMTVEDQEISINANTTEPFSERNSGIYIKQAADDSKFARLQFNVSEEQWKLLDKGYTDSTEELSKLLVGILEADDHVLSDIIETSKIRFETGLTFQGLDDTTHMVFNIATNTLTVSNNVSQINGYFDTVSGNQDQIEIGNILYNTTIQSKELSLLSEDNITNLGFGIFTTDSSKEYFSLQNNDELVLRYLTGQLPLTLTVEGDIEQTGSQTIGNETTSTISLIGDLILSSSSHLTSILGNLSVDELSIFYGQVTFVNTQEFNQNVTMDANLDVDGDVTLGYDDTASHIFNGGLLLSNIGKTTTVRGDLQVNGGQSFTTINASGNLAFTGATNALGTSSSTNNINGDVNISNTGKTTSILGYLNVQQLQEFDAIEGQSLSLTGNLTSNGILSLTNTDVTHSLLGNLTLSSVGKQININSDTLGIQQQTTLSNSLTINDDVSISGSITVGDADESSAIYGTLGLSSVDKLTTIYGGLQVNQNQLFNGDFEINGDVKFGGAANNVEVTSVQTFFNQQDFNDQTTFMNTVNNRGIFNIYEEFRLTKWGNPNKLRMYYDDVQDEVIITSGT